MFGWAYSEFEQEGHEPMTSSKTMLALASGLPRARWGAIGGVVAALSGVAHGGADCAPTILEIAPLFPRADAVVASGISADGSRVLGWFRPSGTSDEVPFVVVDGEPSVIDLPDELPIDLVSLSHISGDGRLVVGTIAQPFDTTQAFRLDLETGEVVFLGGLDPASGINSAPSGISYDGGVVVGGSNSANTTLYTKEAFRWTPDGGMQALGLSPVASTTEPLGVSPTGAAAVGGFKDVSQPSPFPTVAWSWESGAGYTSFAPPIGFKDAIVVASSGDARVLTGPVQSPGVYRGAAWVEGEGVLLPDIEGGAGWMLPGSISSTGSTIVGRANLEGVPLAERTRAFIWTADEGTRDLTAVLAEAGLDLGSAYVQTAELSADGSHALVRLSTPETAGGWPAVIRMPRLRGDLDGDGVIDSSDLNTLLEAYATSSAADLTGDGVTDTSDLSLLLASFGERCGDAG